MTKMQILLDDEKIRREKRYSAEKIRDFVDTVFIEKCKLTKDADGYYIGSGAGDDLMRFGKANYLLSSKDWFLENVKSWIFYCNDDTSDPDEYVIEDVLDFYTQKRGISA
jgi:hypothetical protein